MKQYDFECIVKDVYRLSYLTEFIKKNNNQNLQDLEEFTKELLNKDLEKLNKEIVKMKENIK